jgi:hypothetical protein
LIDMPDSRKTLEFNLNGLLTHLSKRPYKFNGKKIGFSVSIGVLQLSGNGESRDIVINKVKDACSAAVIIEGNSYFIYIDETDKDNTIPTLTNFEQKPGLSDTSAIPESQSISDPEPTKDKEAKVAAGPKPVDSSPVVSDVNETPELRLESIGDQGKESLPVEMKDPEPELTITPEPVPAPVNVSPAVPKVNETPDL